MTFALIMQSHLRFRAPIMNQTENPHPLDKHPSLVFAFIPALPTFATSSKQPYLTTFPPLRSGPRDHDLERHLASYSPGHADRDIRSKDWWALLRMLSLLLLRRCWRQRLLSISSTLGYRLTTAFWSSTGRALRPVWTRIGRHVRGCRDKLAWPTSERPTCRTRLGKRNALLVVWWMM